MNEPRIRRRLPAFEVLAELGRRDPDALQALARVLTDDVIRYAPDAASRRRLEGLKFRIEMERRRSPDPLAACVKLSRMMHESLYELHEVLNEPNGYRRTPPDAEATVLDFSRAAREPL
ncbi:MAG TPA: DUF3135 domain-containing protein [Pseudomonadales bacterium]|jgi:hypothetical protein